MTGIVFCGRVFDVVYDAERGEEPLWVQGGAGNQRACVPVCLPVPACACWPVAGFPIPDIISSRKIRPTSKSRLVFRCISFLLRNPYQDYWDQLLLRDRLLFTPAGFNPGAMLRETELPELVTRA